MSNKKEILQEYTDVHLWLLKIGMDDPFSMQAIHNNAVYVTAKELNQSFDYVNSLISGLEFRYSDEEEPIVRFYHEYLRKIRDSPQ